MLLACPFARSEVNFTSLQVEHFWNIEIFYSILLAVCLGVTKFCAIILFVCKSVWIIFYIIFSRFLSFSGSSLNTEIFHFIFVHLIIPQVGCGLYFHTLKIHHYFHKAAHPAILFLLPLLYFTETLLYDSAAESSVVVSLSVTFAFAKNRERLQRSYQRYAFITFNCLNNVFRWIWYCDINKTLNPIFVCFVLL